MDIRDFVKVKVVEAEQLLAVKGLPPSAYVEVVVGQSRKRTKVFEENINPKWHEAPMVFEHILGDNVDTIMAYIKHKNAFSDVDPSLGVAIIPMDTFYGSPRVEIDRWYGLTQTADMDEKINNCRIRLQIEYDNEADESFLAPGTSDGSTAPNLLQVSVHSVNGLAGKAAIEGFAEVQIQDLRKQTKVCKKSLNPTWNETISFPVLNGNELIHVTLKQSTVIRNIFVGRVRIAMNEVAAAGDTGINKSFTLLNENLEFSDINRGEINLTIKWVFDKETDEENKRLMALVPKKRLFAKMANLFKRKKKTPEEEAEAESERIRAEEAGSKVPFLDTVGRVGAGAGAMDLNQLDQITYLEEQRAKRLEDANYLAELKEEEDIDMPPGDYTIQVHLIDYTDLVGLNDDGTSDPIAYIEVMGQKQHSTVMKKQTSAFIDQYFYFNFKNMTSEQLAQGHIKISVYDYNWLRSQELIGVYQVDIPDVYAGKDHELYRRSAALRDPISADDVGSQGTLKYSIVVLGPNDTQKIHDPTNEDDEAMRDQEIVEGTGALDQSSVPNQSLQYLVVAIAKAEGLPGFDRFISTIKRGLYTYVKLEFAGVEISTVKQAVSGKANLAVTFDQELWIPVFVPSFCKRAALTIMNKEFGRADQVLATAYLNFDDIQQCDTNPVTSTWLGLGTSNYSGPNFEWIHFYGANPLVRGGPKDALFMNRFPSYGSAYRGSLLCAPRIVRFPGGELDEARRVEMNYDISEDRLPQGAMYTFKVMIYQGSDFGSKGAAASAGKGPKYALGIRVGPHEVRSQFKVYENGAVEWGQLMELEMALPTEYKVLPDTIITVYRGNESNNTSVAFHRFKTVEILPKDTSAMPTAKWYVLKHDLSHKSVSTIGFPGSVLLTMALMNNEDIDKEDTRVMNWEPERRKMEIRQDCCLRVFTYQCRNLPAVNDSTVIDPYVKVRFAGQKQKTTVKPSTQSPAFYEHMDFKANLPEELRLCPHVLIQVWDQKKFGNAPIAAVRLSLAEMEDLTIIKNVSHSEIIVPRWYTLYGIDGQKELGEVLLSFKLFVVKDLTKHLPSPRTIVPSLKRAFLDLHLVGLRDLLKHGRVSIRKPFMTFDVVGYGYGVSARSCNFKNNNPTNPNFQDRLVLSIDLPEDPLFTPALEVRVFDERRVGGNILLGYVSIPLLDKIEWNSDDYIPPCSHEVMLQTMKERAIQEEAKKKLQPKNAKRVKGGGKKQSGATQTGETLEDEKDDRWDRSDLRVSDVIDTGIGAFPASRQDDKDAELPYIFDEEERDLEKAAVDKIEARVAELDNLGLSFDDDFAEIDDDNIANLSSKQLRKLVIVPNNWVSADFLKGREQWIRSTAPGGGSELERYLETLPFENYDIFRGHIAYNKFGKRKNTLRKVGLLKAVVRVSVANPRREEKFSKFYASIRQNVPIVVRLYVIRAQNLQPLDGGFFGPPDPYLKVSFGGKEIKDLETKNVKTTAPEFFSVFEFFDDKKTMMPGPSNLKVSVMDKNTVFPDQPLGETTIDLEDRWFHPKWNQMKFDKRYLENRALVKDKSNSPVGSVTLWVDIMTKQDSLKYPPVSIAGPEKLKFEIRIVVWKSSGVKVPGNRFLDMFAQCNMDGDDYVPVTDTHWRNKTGAGSWNYRLKIPIELPLNARERARLRIRLFNRSIITSNVEVGSNSIDLFDWLMIAYKRKTQVVTPYLEIRSEMRKRDLGNFRRSDEDDGDDDGSGEENDDDEDGDSDEELIPGLKSEDYDNDDFEGGRSVASSARSGTGLDDDNQAAEDDSAPLLEGGSTAGNRSSGKSGGIKMNKISKDKKRQAIKEEKALKRKQKRMESGGNEEKVPNIEDTEAEDKEELDSLLKTIRQFLGMGDEIPDDAAWISLSKRDKKNKIHSRGKLAISISIAPQSEVESRPVGAGRDEPNNNPYLPPPVGRMAFSFNPCAVLCGLLSWKVICILVCCCCCVCCLGAFMFISTYLSGIESAIKLLGL